MGGWQDGRSHVFKFSSSQPPFLMLSPKMIGKSRNSNPKGMHYGDLLLTPTLQVSSLLLALTGLWPSDIAT